MAPRWSALILAPLLLAAQQPPLDTLVEHIARHPDALLGQMLNASTYPLEVLEADEWVRGRAQRKDWDPSVEALVASPDVLHWMALDISWTLALGNAVLARPAEVLAAVERVRGKPVALVIVHHPSHRGPVPYPSVELVARYRPAPGMPAQTARGIASRSAESETANWSSAFGSSGVSRETRASSNRGYSSMSGRR